MRPWPCLVERVGRLIGVGARIAGHGPTRLDSRDVAQAKSGTGAPLLSRIEAAAQLTGSLVSDVLQYACPRLTSAIGSDDLVQRLVAAEAWIDLDVNFSIAPCWRKQIT
jgi:hypothetical protein